jgi:hypothetical protein
MSPAVIASLFADTEEQGKPKPDEDKSDEDKTE